MESSAQRQEPVEQRGPECSVPIIGEAVWIHSYTVLSRLEDYLYLHHLATTLNVYGAL